MAPFLITLLLRKVALVPVAIVTLGAAGGAYGSFELTKSVAHLVVKLPPEKQRRRGTAFAANAAALLSAGAVVYARETLFKPVVPPAPAVDVDFTPQGLRRAYAAALHVLLHYPYQHRVTTCLLAGLVAGVAAVSSEVALNAGSGAAAPTRPAAKPVAPRPAEEDDARDSAVSFDGASSGTEMQHEATATRVDDTAFSEGPATARRPTLQQRRERKAEARERAAAAHAVREDEADADANVGSGVEFEGDPYADGRKATVKSL